MHNKQQNSAEITAYPLDDSQLSRLSSALEGLSSTQLAWDSGYIAGQGLLADDLSRLRRQGIACVALPSCPRAMAESERYFPEFPGRLEQLSDKHKLGDLDLHVRMTGCPNGCARPFLAEIGLVGKGPGRYNLMLGGDGHGTRINKLYRENLSQEQILETLDQLLQAYAQERDPQERFGDYVIRAGQVKAVINAARDYHE